MNYTKNYNHLTYDERAFIRNSNKIWGILLDL